MIGAAGRGPDRAEIDHFRFDAFDLEPQRHVAGKGQRHNTRRSIDLREVERQLEKAEKESVQINPGMDKPYGVPPDFAEHFKLMSDMLTIAFQADLTRVSTFMMTREGTSRSYREIGIADGHHRVTHHRNDPALMEKVRRINEYHTQQLAGWLAKLKATDVKPAA